MDHPNERSLHTIPVPRAGGVAILVAFLVGMGMVAFFLGLVVNPILLVCALLVAVVSFLDDCYSLSAALRFFIHFCAALILVVNGYALSVLELPGLSWAWPESIAVVISCLMVVWLINLYNFMDGIDGFAAGMAIVGFSCFALLAWQAQHLLFMSANMIVVAAVAGFLWFNFPPAKIFMGDAGSSTLGFLVAAFSLWASAEKIFPIWVALLVFSPFIVDASVTLLRRLFQGEKIWEAHKSHFYQRLVLVGWGHKKTVLCAYVLMVVCSATAWFAMQVDVTFQWMIIMAWLVAYVLMMIGVVKLARQYA
ncbi:MAG: glycosyltransferase family 4 protein [Thiotrichaceae bacterium]|nr:glycosyltransferase family 4 protein [Thiotrichaceae bacterium]